jgi:hypothetical protein
MKTVNGIPFEEWKKAFSIKLEDEKETELKRMADGVEDVDYPKRPTTVPNHDNPMMGPNFQSGSCVGISFAGINELLAEISVLDIRWFSGVFEDPTPGFENQMYWFWSIPMDFSIE